jgi:hypothetical protein
MIDAPKTKKTDAWGSWKNKPYAANAGTEERRRQSERFSALSEFVRKHGGFVTSPPGKVLRIEAPKGSPLPAKLVELGYNVVSRGSTTRITGTDTINPAGERFVGTLSPFTEVDVLEIRLDGK